MTTPDIQIPVTVGGITFKNPFYVASGPTTKTVQQLQRIEETGWAAASIKLSIDPAPYINRRPRYAAFPQYDALGFTAEKRLTCAQGLALIRDAKAVLRDLKLFANITYAGDRGAAGWADMAKRFEDAGADAIELNMCCPNMSYNVSLTSGGSTRSACQTGASLGQQPEAVAEIVRAIRAVIDIPLFVKLTPEGGRIAQAAKIICTAGADAIGSTANRLCIPPINLDHPEQAVYHLQDEISMSCYSGAWLQPLAKRDVYEIRRVCGDAVKILAVGGITDWRSAAEMILCGGNMLGVCTETLMNGYDIVRPMLAGLRQYMDAHGYASPDDFCGRIVPHVKTAAELTLHSGYAHVREPDLCGPCKAACPLHFPVQAILRQAAQGDWRGAWERLSRGGAAVSFCTHLCTRPCEDACIRGSHGNPVRIQEVLRFVEGYAQTAGWHKEETAPAPAGQRFAVCGDGPAAAACALALAESGHFASLYTRADSVCDTAQLSAAHGLLPAAALAGLAQALRAARVEVQAAPALSAAQGGTVVLTAEEQTPAPPAVPHADALRDGYAPGSSAQQLPRAVVLGDGAAALEEALWLHLRQGCPAAAVLSVRTGERRFLRTLRQRLAQAGIPVYEGYSLRAIEQKENAVCGVSLADAKGAVLTISCGAVVWMPDRIGTARDGDVVVRRWDAHDAAAGFAAGRQLAAHALDRLNGTVPADPNAAQLRTVRRDDVLKRSGYLPDHEPLPPLSCPEAVMQEAARCLRCGCGEGCQLCKTICTDFAPLVSGPDRIAIDPARCVACGMCMNRCPNHNIEMVSTDD